MRHPITHGLAVFHTHLSLEPNGHRRSRQQHETTRVQERHVIPCPLSAPAHGLTRWVGPPGSCAQLFWAKLAPGRFFQSIETPTPASRAQMSSLSLGLVEMSAGFEMPRIFTMRYPVRRTASCTHKSFTAMCRCWHPTDFAWASPSPARPTRPSNPVPRQLLVRCTRSYRSKSPQWLESNSTTSRTSLPHSASPRWSTCAGDLRCGRLSLSGNGFPIACFLCCLSEAQNYQ